MMGDGRKSVGQEVDSLIVTFKGRRFDIADFLGRHPGGAEVLLEADGRNLDKILNGDAAVLSRTHTHSENALRMLEKYALDKSKSDAQADSVVDTSLPVVTQVHKLGTGYWPWIHRPLDHNLRMFESDWLEVFTRTYWWVIPTIWAPFVLFFTGVAVHLFVNDLQFGKTAGFVSVAILWAIGFVAWTALEYVLHRFVFHWRPDTTKPWQIVLHFLMHGLHHKTPMDKGRLVFPPLPAAFIVLFHYGVYSIVLPMSVMFAFGAGQLAGYICYDMTHYYLHHGKPALNSHYHQLKLYHHAHHYKSWDTGYGISTKIWDHVFQTVGPAA